MRPQWSLVNYMSGYEQTGVSTTLRKNYLTLVRFLRASSSCRSTVALYEMLTASRIDNC